MATPDRVLEPGVQLETLLGPLDPLDLADLGALGALEVVQAGGLAEVRAVVEEVVVEEVRAEVCSYLIICPETFSRLTFFTKVLLEHGAPLQVVVRAEEAPLGVQVSNPTF